MGSIQPKRIGPWTCVKRIISSCDVVIEVLDARFPQETRSREIETMVRSSGKRLIILLNKADLVPRKSRNELRLSLSIMKSVPVVLFSAKARWAREKSLLFRMILLVGKPKPGMPVRAGIIGFPNTGKSSVINFLTNRSVAKTSTISGFTRGIQWINCGGRFRGRVMFMDTPGVIPIDRRLPGMEEGLLLTCALSPDKVENLIAASEKVIEKLLEENPGFLFKHYDLVCDEPVPSAMKPSLVLELIGRRRGKLLKGGVIDLNESAKIVLREWQAGKLIP